MRILRRLNPKHINHLILRLGSMNLFENLPLTHRLSMVETAMKLLLSKGMDLPEASLPFSDTELMKRADEFNTAAEKYFTLPKNHTFVMNKPFSERMMFGQRLFDFGVQVHWLRLKPGETVLDFGAGSCWMSFFLNRFGCRTLSVDISPSALKMGRSIFQQDPATDWSLGPEFIPYDGHRLPFTEESIDKIIIYDAFHHVPNQEEILRELYRVLKKHGIVSMSEPGRFHASSGASLRDMTETGVLENSIVVEDLAILAKACGFTDVKVVPLTLQNSLEVPAKGLNAFLAGERFADYWMKLRDSLINSNHLFLYKEKYVPDTRRPGRLEATLSFLEGPDEFRVHPEEKLNLRLLLKNTGDTLWLSRILDLIGQTQLGAHLYRQERKGPALNFDWLRQELPHDINPGGEVILDVELPPLQEPGDYVVVLDMVSERIAWFEEFGSKPLEFRLQIVKT